MKSFLKKTKDLSIENYAIIAVIVVTFIVGILNYFVAAKISAEQEIGGLFPNYLIFIDVVLISFVGVYIVYRARKFLKSKKKDLFTFKFQTKIVLILGSLCIVPIIVILVFSLSFFNLGAKTWLNDIVDIALNESLEVSNVYIEEHRDAIANDLFRMKKITEKNTKMILLNSNRFDNVFSGHAATLSLTEAVIFLYNSDTKVIKILSKTPFSFFPSIDKFDFEENYHPNALGYSVIFNDDDNYIRAITSVNTIPNTYILVGRLINDKVIRHVKNAQDANSNYNKLKVEMKQIQRQFIVVFMLVISLILLSVILLTMYYSSRVFLPIMDIVLATRQVSQGKYDVLLNTKNTNEEVAVLLKSFNRMVKLIGQKSSDLNLSNQIMTSKKKFLEGVLGALPAATIVLDVNKKVKLFNKAAKQLFVGKSLNNIDMSIVCPEIELFLDKLHGTPDDIIDDKIIIKQGNKKRQIHIFASIEKSPGEINGYILNIFSYKS